MKTQRDEGAPTNAVKATTLAPPRRHTEVTLLALVGSTERDTVVSYVMGASQTELIERGARIATTRVVEEGAAIAGVAAEFMAVATQTQRRLLATVTPTFLSALATGLHTATGMDATLSRRRARAATKRKAARVVAAVALPGIRARRELFRTHLLAMSNGDRAWASRINDACGAAPGGAELAASLDTMVTEGRALAAHTKARGGEVSVDETYFAEIVDAHGG